MQMEQQKKWRYVFKHYSRLIKSLFASVEMPQGQIIRCMRIYNKQSIPHQFLHTRILKALSKVR